MRRVLLIIALVGAYIAAGRPLAEDNRMYSLIDTRECLEGRGREVRYEKPQHGFPTLYVGPFNNGAPGEPTDVLEFAPSPGRANDAKYRDSDATPRRGNVLSPSGFSDPLVEECLDQSRRGDESR